MKNSQENGPAGTKKEIKTERLKGLGRRTREGIAKWYQMAEPEITERGNIAALPSGTINYYDSVSTLFKNISTISILL